MSRIVAAIVDTQAHADRLRAAVLSDGLPPDRVDVFFLNPTGQHDLHDIGGDAATDPQAASMPGGAVKGAAAGAAIGTAAGAVVGALVPPLAPITVAGGAGVGAYVGSLAGAVSAGGEQPPADAVRAARDAAQDAAQDAARQRAAARPDDVAMRSERRTRRSGMVVAVCVDGPETAQDDHALRVADLLRAHGADHVELADGRFDDGHWADFDPARAPRLVAPRDGRPAS